MPRKRKYDDIYHAVFQMTGKDKKGYMSIWLKRHPGKEKVWITDVAPYLDPPYLLWSAPRENPILSLLNIIIEENDLDIDIKEVLRQRVEVYECEECGLKVVYRTKHEDRLLCLKCFSQSTLDENE